MTIQVGDKLPDVTLLLATPDGPQPTSSGEFFAGKKVALFAVPGAYTGTCHKMHLPSIFLNAYALKDKGVDTIAIVSVNEAVPIDAAPLDVQQLEPEPEDPIMVMMRARRGCEPPRGGAHPRALRPCSDRRGGGGAARGRRFDP